MSDGCDQEMCPFWTGSGCACDVLEIDEHERARARDLLGLEDPRIPSSEPEPSP